MVSVGIVPSEDQIKLFNELKVDKLHRYLVIRLNKDRNGLETGEVGARDSTIKDLESILPKDNCCFVVFDFEYETFENPPRQTSKLLLICWAPDIAPIKIKVPFSSTKSDIKANFPGIQKDIQASDFAILDFEEMRKECCSK